MDVLVLGIVLVSLIALGAKIMPVELWERNTFFHLLRTTILLIVGSGFAYIVYANNGLYFAHLQSDEE